MNIWLWKGILLYYYGVGGVKTSEQACVFRVVHSWILHTTYLHSRPSKLIVFFNDFLIPFQFLLWSFFCSIGMMLFQHWLDLFLFCSSGRARVGWGNCFLHFGIFHFLASTRTVIMKLLLCECSNTLVLFQRHQEPFLCCALAADLSLWRGATKAVRACVRKEPTRLVCV